MIINRSAERAKILRRSGSRNMNCGLARRTVLDHRLSEHGGRSLANSTLIDMAGAEN
jgi:hypothetical protein